MSHDHKQPLVRYSGKNLDAPAHSSPYPGSRIGGPISLVDTAAAIERASESVAHQVSAQLAVIARQIHHLQQQAREVLEKAQGDLELHRVLCNFQRIPGKTYHLYRRANGCLAFSLLSPADYGGNPPHEFVGTYRLEANNSWTRAESVQRVEVE